jgi:hypothetical protein
MKHQILRAVEEAGKKEVNGGETSLISRFAIPVALGLGPYSTGRTLHCLQVLTTPFPCLISASYYPLSLFTFKTFSIASIQQSEQIYDSHTSRQVFCDMEITYFC